MIIKTLLVLLFQVFFCKYNDPFYIKQAKLRVIMSLVTIDTVETVLSELKEYASEVDLDFVRQSVRAISSCAVRFEIIAEVAVQLLLELIGSQINYVVQEAIIAMKDIIRCYPNRFEHSVPVLCDALSTLDQPDAKAALFAGLTESLQKEFLILAFGGKQDGIEPVATRHDVVERPGNSLRTWRGMGEGGRKGGLG